MKTTTLYLNRITITKQTTDGELRTRNGQRICDTAEHTEEMLPMGTYQVNFRRNARLAQRAPYLYSRHQECRTSSYIIHGNGAYGKRCGANIIVGRNLVPGVVTQSTPSFNRLVKRLDKVYKRGGNVIIIIRERQG